MKRDGFSSFFVFRSYRLPALLILLFTLATTANAHALQPMALASVNEHLEPSKQLVTIPLSQYPAISQRWKQDMSLLEEFRQELLLRSQKDAVSSQKSRQNASTEQNTGYHVRGAKHSNNNLADVYQDVAVFTSEQNAAKVVVPMGDGPRSRFVGPVGIGSPPQTFWLIFDTGSTNLQVVGNQCNVASCLKVSRFDASKSSTFMPSRPRVEAQITFGTGRIHSEIGTDQVTLGQFVIPNQTFGIIYYEEEEKENATNIFDDIYFEGILGLGFPSLGSTGQTPLFDNLMLATNGTISPQFAIYMDNAPDIPFVDNSSLIFSSAFLLGGVDPRFFEPPIRYVPVMREHYWQLELKSLWVGSVRYCCNPGDRHSVILDSGTSFNSVPSKEALGFLSLIPSGPCNLVEKENSSHGNVTYPTIVYRLAGDVDIELTPEMYLLKGFNDECTPAFMPLDVPRNFGHAYILGAIPFMQYYFTVFTRGTGTNNPSMIGIAKAKHTTEIKQYLHQLGTEALRNNHPIAVV